MPSMAHHNVWQLRSGNIAQCNLLDGYRLARLPVERPVTLSRDLLSPGSAPVWVASRRVTPRCARLTCTRSQRHPGQAPRPIAACRETWQHRRQPIAGTVLAIGLSVPGLTWCGSAAEPLPPPPLLSSGILTARGCTLDAGWTSSAAPRPHQDHRVARKLTRLSGRACGRASWRNTGPS